MRWPRIAAAALALAALSGCATSLTWGRISPLSKESDFVSDVTSAHRLASGAVVICVKGSPARTPSPFSSYDEAFSLTLPPSPSLLAPWSVRRGIPRYQLTGADVGRACPEKTPPGAASLAVRRVESKDLGFEYSSDVSYDSLASLLAGPLAGSAAVLDVKGKFATVFYVDESPRFEGRRALVIQTHEREVKGQPAYLLLLPFAVVFDVLMFPLELLVVVATGH